MQQGAMWEFLEHQFNVLASVAASSLNLWRGTMLEVAAVQPAEPLRLYEFEGSPECTAVREVLTALHLDAEIFPCPQNGRRYRSGDMVLPQLLDANSNKTIRGAAEIVSYLFETYAGKEVPPQYRDFIFKQDLSALAKSVRGGAGTAARRSKAPEKMLHLWSFESSPYSRLVRERLCELEIAYVLHNVGKEQWQDLGPAVLRLKPGPYEPVAGQKRAEHFSRTGHMQVPYLEDPNTGIQLLDSQRILEYLEQTYAL